MNVFNKLPKSVQPRAKAGLPMLFFGKSGWPRGAMHCSPSTISRLLFGAFRVIWIRGTSSQRLGSLTCRFDRLALPPPSPHIYINHSFYTDSLYMD